MPDSNIFKCKSKYKSANNNGSYNISDIKDLMKKEIASKKKHETIDEEFFNDEAAGNFI